MIKRPKIAERLRQGKFVCLNLAILEELMSTDWTSLLRGVDDVVTKTADMVNCFLFSLRFKNSAYGEDIVCPMLMAKIIEVLNLCQSLACRVPLVLDVGYRKGECVDQILKEVGERFLIVREFNPMSSMRNSEEDAYYFIVREVRGLRVSLSDTLHEISKFHNSATQILEVRKKIGEKPIIISGIENCVMAEEIIISGLNADMNGGVIVEISNSEAILRGSLREIEEKIRSINGMVVRIGSGSQRGASIARVGAISDYGFDELDYI